MTETAEPMAVRRPRPARRERGRLIREVQPEDWRDSRMGCFSAAAEHRTGRVLASYEALWTWSIEEPDEFLLTDSTRAAVSTDLLTNGRSGACLT